ncbi:MAG TPA: hypothetical protein VGA70_09065 [Longimicrobiales bacterium]|jgi:hypothetical protein
MIPTRDRTARPGPSAATALLVAGLGSALGACDLPTELPVWDTVWEAVVVEDSIAAADLLPPEMRVTDDGFVMDSFVTHNTIRIEDVCEFCTCFDGPVPALDIVAHDWRIRLPSRVIEADVIDGSARLTVHNEVPFDVLDDGQGNRGHLTVELIDTRTDQVLGARTVAEPLPPGDSLVVDFDLPALTLGGQLVARVSGKTPGSGCDSVTVAPDDGFRAEVLLRNVRVSSALVVLSDGDLAFDSRDIELPGFIASRLRPGDASLTLDVRISSRLPVEAEFGLSLAGGFEDLFTERAALYTPVVVRRWDRLDPVLLNRTYIVEEGALQGAERVFLSSRNRILGNRLVRFTGGESVAYSVRLHAEIPSR